MMMKQTAALLAVSAAALTLAACNQQQGSEAVDKAQDAVSEPVGQTSAATMGANMVSAYVPNAAMGDMYEIQAADIAMERSKNAQVKELAQMIKTDHTAASTALKAAAGQAAPDTTLPTELDQRRKGLIDNLRSASAADFDKTYIDQQVAAHEEAVTLHRGFSDKTDAPALAEHARTVLPKIEAHLERAKQLQSNLVG
jgi:putative membrane protein